MRKLIAVIGAVGLATVMVGCGAPKTLAQGQKEYPTYGLFNENTAKSKNVCYQISTGNVVLSIIFSETIIMPIYFVGWSIYNPIRLKQGPDDQCTFDS